MKRRNEKTSRPASRVHDEDLAAVPGGTLLGTAVKQAWEKAKASKDIQPVSSTIAVLIG